ncbi:MAG: hypothetical protein KatS3mg012_0667 [Gaiellaceae bacterium]|nr:MAG: hypothetical protein KatS3mg012_0667 [Gaiellaceae bacterium]
MSRLIPTAASLTAAGALALALGGNALGAPSPSADFGQHAATCAQEHVGQREGAPSVTCTHDGLEMTFPTFGAMVQHMRDHHG